MIEPLLQVLAAALDVTSVLLLVDASDGARIDSLVGPRPATDEADPASVLTAMLRLLPYGAPSVVDLSRQPMLAAIGWTLDQRPVRSIVASPMTLPDGSAFGALCVLDTRPRILSRSKRALLAGMCQPAMQMLLLHRAARRLVPEPTPVLTPTPGITADPAQFAMMLEQHLAAVGRGRSFAVMRVAVRDPLADSSSGEEVASRIAACIRQTDLLSQDIDGQFLVLLADVKLPEEVALLAERMRRALEVPAAIGVTMCPTDGTRAATLLRNAAVALARARSDTHATCSFFSTDTQQRLHAREALRADLGQALEAKQFSLVYQPVVGSRSGEVRAVEALLRWNHPVRGQVPPLDFIPGAEASGLIVPIGQWVLEQACHDAMQLPPDTLMSVNLSPAQISHPGLERTVAQALRHSGLPPARLVLEITETVPLLEDQNNLRVLNGLREMGVRIALDDFGTGYASLSYLMGFSFDIIKIERSFVARMLDGEQTRTIVRAVIRLSRALGIRSVAEGVESQAQADFLRAEGCQALQGYLFSAPVSAALLPQTLKALRARHRHEASLSFT